MATRRGFIGALLAVPVLGKIGPTRLRGLVDDGTFQDLPHDLSLSRTTYPNLTEAFKRAYPPKAYTRVLDDEFAFYRYLKR